MRETEGGERERDVLGESSAGEAWRTTHRGKYGSGTRNDLVAGSKHHDRTQQKKGLKIERGVKKKKWQIQEARWPVLRKSAKMLCDRPHLAVTKGGGGGEGTTGEKKGVSWRFGGLSPLKDASTKTPEQSDRVKGTDWLEEDNHPRSKYMWKTSSGENSFAKVGRVFARTNQSVTR